MSVSAASGPAPEGASNDFEVLVIDVFDEEAGLADVEDSRGRTYQVPTEWFVDGSDGAAYRVTVSGHSVTLTPDPDGARLLRERSKQTLLDFSDEPEEQA